MIDDVHELDPDEALRQLELLVMRGPQELRFVLATRHDVRLGLHRLRLEGELTELRTEDLRFTLEEARQLLRGARGRAGCAGAGVAVRADRGVGGRAATGGIVAGRAPRAGAARSGVLR